MNMNNNEALKDLRDIRSMMERSSRFQAVNGWGVLAAGVMALVAAWVAGAIFNGGSTTLYGDTDFLWDHKTQIAVWGSLVLVVVCGLTVFFSSMWLARRRNIPFVFDSTMCRLLLAFSVPLLTGGLLCLALVLQEHYGLTSSMMLIFYGLSLVACHHFTHPALGLLGYAELVLGLVDCFTSNNALLFWALGFGVLHIVFGIYLVVKLRRT